MKKLIQPFTLTAVIILSPAALHATRGPEDYGLVTAFMTLVYAFPVGLLLLGFIIYLASRLKKKDMPKKQQGNIVFIISLVIIVLSIIIPLFWIFWSDNPLRMLGFMAAVFLPVILLALIVSILAARVKKIEKGS